MPGPMPKDPSTRERRNRVSTAAVIEAEPARRPSLGRFRPDDPGLAWHAETRRWWRIIWDSPIAERWLEAHVPGLRALARLVDDFWRATNPNDAKQLHAEIRMAEREYGLTVWSARAMSWEFRRPAGAEQRKAAAPLPAGADPRKVLSLDRVRAG